MHWCVYCGPGPAVWTTSCRTQQTRQGSPVIRTRWTAAHRWPPLPAHGSERLTCPAGAGRVQLVYTCSSMQCHDAAGLTLAWRRHRAAFRAAATSCALPCVRRLPSGLGAVAGALQRHPAAGNAAPASQLCSSPSCHLVALTTT
jgi:hypothetical protein